ncbi:TIGR03557 family F420-dependent LLM class oxidoreductase [Actinomarinicola tropica]|uniref:TIGR03557 family F420-dependent LLM class oxidoreductase n=1 Tax=Actinomarinicola tropica TaxID=2789776 RepID=A0A5Q2RLB6_9ACTN|nr:TIGR03557 family F420-dependent LLM class oxidoreductase [Actinomarinicola tropica]QGG95722.1 TIGR03557 family F420-dependent LLM class oxidoreductase [Actinomarinicola tropica]
MPSHAIKIGYTLSSEEHGPKDLVRFGAMAVEHGFDRIDISDHFHPWTDEQGQSPFVWSVMGALAQAAPDVRIGTGVTCPTVRIHPAIVAQAAATQSLLTGGGFFLGVGTGENLNEHVLGDRWPPADIRLSMLEEAVEVMRKLWTGDQVTHVGEHYRVENARLYTAPDGGSVPVYVSAFGPKAAELAGRIGDGLVTTSPDAEAVEGFRSAGGSGPAIAAAKACWAEDEAAARATVHRLWPNSGLPGELAQELPMPAHFEQASQLVTEDQAADGKPCGPDPEVHVASLRAFAEAGYDEVYIHQIGPEQEGFMRFYRDEVLPRL